MKPKRVIPVALVVVAVAVAGGYLLLKRHAEQTVRRQVASIALRIPGVTAVDYASAQIDWADAGMRIEGVTVFLSDPVESVFIDEVRVHDIDPAHDVPDRLDVEIVGLRLPGSQPRLQPLQPYLAEAGYTALVADVRLVYRFDRSRRLLAIDKLEVTADDAGSLNLSARFENVDLPRLLKNMTDRIYLLTALPGVSVAGAELVFADDTLTGRLLAALARRIRQTPREAALAVNEALEERFGPTNRPQAREALAGLQSFITAPKTLRLSAVPPAPVSFLQFLWARNPSDFVQLLHIRVEG
jgi:hypothetical protein